ncbi:MAG: toll/interleukin-1 receptor domain-containing protein, partial [Ignavibacteria bacterium]
LPFEAYNGEKPYIFVCYSHRNISIVYDEIKKIHDFGYRIWYDEGITPSSEWPEEIAKALQNASFFIVFISNSSIASANVRNEINFALNKGKKFLAIYLENTTLPPGLELRMGDIQSINKWRLSEEHYNRKILNVLPKDLIEKQFNAEKNIITSNSDKRINEPINVSLKSEKNLSLIDGSSAKISRKRYFVGSIILFILISTLYYLFVYKNSDNKLDIKNTQITNSKESVDRKSEELDPGGLKQSFNTDKNEAQNFKINLLGKYSGSIKDGTKWYVYINDFEGSSIKGYNEVYWKKTPNGFKTNFTGTYEPLTRKITMLEDINAKGSGKFVGTVSVDGRTIMGDWHRYTDNNSFTWNLNKVDN